MRLILTVALLLSASNSSALIVGRAVPRVGLAPIGTQAPLKSLRFAAAAAGRGSLPSASIGSSWAQNTWFFDGMPSQGGMRPVAASFSAPFIPNPLNIQARADSPPLVPHLAPPSPPGRTPLEKHAAFFDLDGDGILTVNHTRRRLVQLGIGGARAAVVALLIHVGLSNSTSDSWTDVALLRIRVANIQKGIHAGDTGVYDKDGYFNAVEFERMFSEFAKSNPNRLNEDEILALREANSKRRPGFLGKIGAQAEFDLLLDIAADGTEQVGDRSLRTISRAQLRSFYDGTLLYRLVGESY